MPSRVIDRLQAARNNRFVGRLTEQWLFQSTLQSDELPFLILNVYGPGGFGKTTLLSQFANYCYQQQIPAFTIDGRNFEPLPDEFLWALQLAMGLDRQVSALDVLAGVSDRQVILIDTFELLTAIEDWLRDVFLPRLSTSILVVIAGRNPLSSAWRSDPGWQSLIRMLPLHNLSQEESQSYLLKRQIPPGTHQAIVDFTYGHPLALSLVADAFIQQGETTFTSDVVADVIRVLIERFMQKVPSASHRTALEACALVRVTNEAILAVLLDVPDAHELFAWLQSLSFVQIGPGGLFPHDLTRDVILADLRWRNARWYGVLHHRARSYYLATLQATQVRKEQVAIIFDLIFLHRDNPAVRRFFNWQDRGSTAITALQDGDKPALIDMVARYEGTESAKLAAYWFDHQPEGTHIFRDSQDQPVGFITTVALHQVTADDIQADAGVRAAWQYLQKTVRLRPGEKAVAYRFWMARDTYQAVSVIQSGIFVSAIQQYLSTGGLAYTFFYCADPDFWLPMFIYGDLQRVPEADFEIGGHRYGAYGHDWRLVPPSVWLGLLAERELTPETPRQTPTFARQIEPMVVLDQAEFEIAVQNGLRSFLRPAQLRNNPLLRSRLVVQRADPDASEGQLIETLQTILREAGETMQNLPRDDKLYRAVYYTYFQPAETQEQAAELLDLPFSTYRRYLKSGIARIAELLWQQETGG